MSPRPYSMQKRQLANSETRTRILQAALQLLSSPEETELSMEAIARGADVSRLTVYYQFDSRARLLEALYDYLAERGHMRRMPEVFQERDPRAAINRAVGIFVDFWASDPVAIREKYGKRVRLWGGVNKRALAGTREDVRQEMCRLQPYVEQGAFIPTVDHRVPADVPLDNYKYYLDLKRELLHVGGEPKY